MDEDAHDLRVLLHFDHEPQRFAMPAPTGQLGGIQSIEAPLEAKTMMRDVVSAKKA